MVSALFPPKGPGLLDEKTFLRHSREYSDFCLVTYAQLCRRALKVGLMCRKN